MKGKAYIAISERSPEEGATASYFKNLRGSSPARTAYKRPIRPMQVHGGQRDEVIVQDGE